MFLRPHTRHRLIQLACLALLAAALLGAWRPALMRAMSFDPASADLCSAMGLHADASSASDLAPAASGHEGGAAVAEGHCDACCGVAAAWAPVEPGRGLPPVAALPLWPALLLVAPHTLAVWASALARAPPRSA